MLIIRGVNVFPSEIEHALLAIRPCRTTSSWSSGRPLTADRRRGARERAGREAAAAL
jgi:hypothetical protein